MNNFISYDYIFNNFKEGDIFYDRELRRFEMVKTFTHGLIKEIVIVDENGYESSVYNYTKLSRIILSTGLPFHRIKKSIFWDKLILLSEECADELIEEEQGDIIIEYKDMLKDGVETGIISKKEYKELIENI